jgi:SAM-dependent methyltransferase
MIQMVVKLGSIYPARKARNVVRGLLQAYGPSSVKRYLWNAEFAGGRWRCLESTPDDCVYQFVEKYADNGRILDLGCGSGSTGNELNPSSYREYVGVDISDVAIAQAMERTDRSRRAQKNQYFQSDIFTYVPAGGFDVILFRDSIYYIQRPKIRGMLERYSKYLTNRGVFVVRLWDGGHDTRLVDVIESNFDVLERHVDSQKAVVLVFR